MTRRDFILLAGVATSAGRLLGCSYPDDYCLPVPPEPNVSRIPAKPFTPDERRILPRPLLSEIVNDPNPARLESLAHQRARAYQILADRSRRSSNPDTDLRGYLAQTWFHHWACKRGGVHDNWQFLPWHRGFLYFHERMIRRIPGFEDFRIPVWDWENINDIPTVYCRQWLHWSSSPLAKENARDKSDMGNLIDRCSMQSWLLSGSFEEFAGGPPGDSKWPPPKAAAGEHSLVHLRIGGFLARTEWAAADPLFFAHHANIDRYWIEWCRAYGEILLPDDAAVPKEKKFWGQSFTFFDENGELRSITADKLKDVRTLGYYYEPPKPLNLKLPPKGSPEGTHPKGPPNGSPPNKDTVYFNFTDLRANLPAIDRFFGEPSPPGTDALSSLPKLLSAAKQLTNARIPVYFWANLGQPDPMDRTSTYLMGFAAPGTTRILGPFAVFSSHAHDGIVGAVCLSLEDLVWLATVMPDPQQSNLTPVKFVYGPPADSNYDAILNNTPKPLYIRSIEIRVDPANLLQSMKLE
jgi:hypothetical protein